MRRTVTSLAAPAILTLTLTLLLAGCGDSGGGGEQFTQVDQTSTTAAATSAPSTTTAITAPADYTCTNLTADTAAFNGRMDQVLDVDGATAATPGFADAAPTLVAELIADCGRAWATELSHNLPSSSAAVLDAIIAGTAPTTTAAPTTAPPVTTTAGRPADSGPDWFVSPSGNIGCSVFDSGARCDIGERYWTPPPQPSSCDLDWGNALLVDPSGASFGCVGDTALGAPTVLPYGSSARRGTFVCESRDVGMTCRDEATGHGFFVARERYELF